MKNKKVFGLVLASIMVLSACATTSTVTQNGKVAGKTYKIGVLAPLSGPAAAIGTELQKVTESEIAKVNAKNDYKIEATYEDGKCDAAASKSAYDKLTQVDGIKFIIGGLCSSETLGYIDSLTSDGVFDISATNSNPVLEGKSVNYVSVSYSDSLVGQGLAEEMGKYKTAALISEQNDYNIGVKKVVEETLKAKYPNTKIVADETFEKGSTDFRNSLDKIKAKNPEALLLNTNPGVTSDAMLKEVGEIKLGAKLLGIQAYTSAATLAKAPGVGEGMVVIDAPGVGNPAFQATYDQLVKDLGTLDDLGVYYAAAQIDAVDMLSAEIAKNDGDVAKVLKDVRAGTFEMNIGKVSFGDKTYAQGIGVAKYIVKGDKAVKQ